MPKVTQNNFGIQLIKPVMHCKQSNNEGTYHHKENGVLVTDKTEMAETFNNYFSHIQNVGEEHDSVSDVAVNISVHPSIAVIREECVTAQFEFDHVSVAETELILQFLDPNNATGHDQIPALVLRDGASVLAAPIARLVNIVIDSACVPAEWKLAETCPISSREMTSLASPNTGLYPS